MAAVDSSDVKPTLASTQSHNNLPVSLTAQENDTTKFRIMPDLVGANAVESSDDDDEDKKERRDKFRRNEIEYAQHLKAKYFSNKTFTGDNVFEDETKIEDEIIKSSRWPCTSAFADPAKHLEKKQKLEESTTVPASSGAETCTPTKKPPSKKSP